MLMSTVSTCCTPADISQLYGDNVTDFAGLLLRHHTQGYGAIQGRLTCSQELATSRDGAAISVGQFDGIHRLHDLVA